MILDFIAILSIIIFIFLVFLLLYINKNQFWITQPVFHIYDLSYYFRQVKKINNTLPLINSYTDLYNIQFMKFNDFKKKEQNINDSLHLINKHYNPPNYFLISTHFLPYFDLIEKEEVFISFLYNKKMYLDTGNNIIDRNSMIGNITSRKMNVFFFEKGQRRNDSIGIQYIDYLCVHKDFRKQKMAPKLIQTHYYNLSHHFKNTPISLFKKEGDLNSLIPLCLYKTYFFSSKKWNKPLGMPPNYKIIRINHSNFKQFVDFLTGNLSQLLNIFISPSYENILSLLDSHNYYIYLVINQTKLPLDQVECVYIFKKPCIAIDNKDILSCIGSLKIEDMPEDKFQHIFKVIFWDLCLKYRFRICMIEDISYNHLLLNNLLQKNVPIFKETYAYYFHNYLFHTVSSKKVLILT
jgi:hypothetical protein